MYLAMKTVLLREALKDDDEWHKLCIDLSQLTGASELKNRNRDEIKEVHDKLKNCISKAEVTSKILNLEKSSQFQSKFFCQYLKMFEAILMFVRASRQNLWKLHLSSLNNFAPYFFAFDQINYARLTPFYLATMKELETNDQKSWDYLKENYSVIKTSIPFVGIGSDYAMEQENKNLKISGGIIGITQNQDALNRFCLVGPILNLISTKFEEKQNILREEKSRQHYQLKGAFNKRLHSNVEKIVNAMESFDVSFSPSEYLTNVVTKAVLPKKTSEEFLKHEQIGKARYDTFIKDRIRGEHLIWEPMKKTNLQTFKSLRKKVKLKIGEKIVEMRAEKQAMSRFLIASRKRPEIELEQCIGDYEFSVVPRSLFSFDGQPLPSTDKSKLLHLIEEMSSFENTEPKLPDAQNSVIILDGMAVVNQVKKDKSIKTCEVSRKN